MCFRKAFWHSSSRLDDVISFLVFPCPGIFRDGEEGSLSQIESRHKKIPLREHDSALFFEYSYANDLRKDTGDYIIVVFSNKCVSVTKFTTKSLKFRPAGNDW